MSISAERRIHIGLAVSNLPSSMAFYQTLLGIPPTKERNGYAKFESVDPPVNLSLIETGQSVVTPTAPSHFGVQVKSSAAVHAVAERFRLAGWPTRIENETTCCYAVQTKVWIADPDGARWEVFVVLDPDAAQSSDESACCSDANRESCCAESCCG